MKFFISYRFTGEDLNKLKPLLESIQQTLESKGNTNYCSFEWQTHFEKNNFSSGDILRHSLKELDDADVVLAFINSADKSEGMLLEIGYALAKGKKIYTLIRQDVNPVFIRDISDKVIEFKEPSDIPELLAAGL